MKKKENMECKQEPSFLRSLPTMTEEQNKQQYESFITSCVHTDNWDMIVSYKEWLGAVQPQLPTTDAEYEQYHDSLDRLNKATTMSADQLRKILKRS